MPTVRFGFFLCDFCGLQFDTGDEAARHEVQCPQRRYFPHHPPSGLPLTTTPAPHHQTYYFQQPQQYQQPLPGPYYGFASHPPPQPPRPHSTNPPSPEHKHHKYHAQSAASSTHSMHGSGPANARESQPASFAQNASHDNLYDHASFRDASDTTQKGKHPAYDDQGRNDERHHQHFQQQQQQQVQQGLCYILVGPHETPPSLSEGDIVSLRCVEMFEVTNENIDLYHNMQLSSKSTMKSASSSSPSLSLHQTGIRCIFCSPINNHEKNNQKGKFSGSINAGDSVMPSQPGSFAFPENIASIPNHVRMLTDDHVAYCRCAPKDIQDALQRTRALRTEDGTLLEYCSSKLRDFGILNRSTNVEGRSTSTMSGQPNFGIEFTLPVMPDAGNESHEMKSTGRYSREISDLPPQAFGARTEFFQHSHASQTNVAVPSRTGQNFADQFTASSLEDSSSITLTPLQRRRDRSEEPSTEATQAARQHDVSAGALASADNAIQNLDAAHSRQVAHSQHPSQVDYNQVFDLPSTFPFFHDRDRSWRCKFCINVPVFHRDPQSAWTSPDGGPPPGTFIDQHLSICSSYQQGYMPHAGGGYASPYHHHYGMYASQQPYYAYGAPPGGAASYDDNQVPKNHMPQNPAIGSSHPTGPPLVHGKTALPPGRPSMPQDSMHSGEDPAMIPFSAGGHDPGFSLQHDRRRHDPSVSQADSETVRRSIDYLVRFDNDYWTRDVKSEGAPRLVVEEDKLLLTDYFFYLMKQLRLCRFSESDRKTRGGKREKIKIGYGGLQCIHCSDLPMSRKFFWSNVDRLANSFAEIPGHVMKCRRCPQQTKESLLKLKQIHPEQMAKLPRGSQKVFFRRMWRRIHDDDEEFQQTDSPRGPSGALDELADQPSLTVSTSRGQDGSPGSAKTDVSPMSGSNTISSNDTVLVVQRTAAEAAKVLSLPVPERGPSSPSSKVLLAIPEDKEWLSEKDCYIRKQIEVFRATEEDVALAQRDRLFPISPGTIGFRCLHCSLAKQQNAGDHAVFYPLSVSGIYESVREFQRLHLDSCKNFPSTTRAKLDSLQGASSLSSVLRKYYNLAAKALGLYDSKDGIRSGGKASPIGSQAAFTFPEEDMNSSDPMTTKADNDQGGNFQTMEKANQGEQGVDQERKRRGRSYSSEIELGPPQSKTTRTSPTT